ncbi:von Willebrand factor type A (vWA) domain-containing protein [Oleiphilus messinensis]|uniref:von Willebrand factor type A (VWA) domain-containing protein n=1 Tax=Oleiphilus messinensis TaxID=141451 RepID=A0A1Y0ID36_9GAMM|nr:VWA domain-containing protein [Oleiphilus messinensis]ARU57385.1 von Willebrand factor type A (vWA) domain-containing protein [Oleiphilus messinensis]
MRLLPFRPKSQYSGFVCFFLFLFFNALPVSAADGPSDVRVLIDISGSMKKNDPNNLRIPAVNLLTELVPDGSTAGIWTFGQYVNMLVKHQKVDDLWRKMAKNKAKEINSVALYTNIGGAVETASDDFYKSESFENTHFILLTDGVVDIDRDPDKNLSERNRILSDVLSRISDRGARIHTVALSQNADLSLMEKLAVKTGGLAEVANSSEDLTRIFVRALDQAVPAEEVPLEGNTFDIDSSVEELTALIFKKPGSQPTRIIEPDDNGYSKGQKPDYVDWYSDKGYDLVTIKQPLEGQWRIEADLLPDSRVTVVSNLSMEVAQLPSNFFAGQTLHMEVAFKEGESTIVNPDFLKLIDVDLNIQTEDGKSGTKRLSKAEAPPENGIFEDNISKLRREGRYIVNVLADGKTFKRKHRQVITLRSPLNLEMIVAKDDRGESIYRLVIAPQNKEIDTDKTKIVTKIKAPDGNNLIKTVPFNKASGNWELDIFPNKGDGKYVVQLKVKGVTTDGGEFTFAPRSFDAVYPIEVGAQAIQSIPEPEESEPDSAVEDDPDQPDEPASVDEADESVIAPINVPETLEQESPDVTGNESDDAAPEEQPDWLLIGAAAGGGLLLLAGALFAFLKMRKGKQKGDETQERGSDDPELGDTDTFDEPDESLPEAAPVAAPAKQEPVLEIPEEDSLDDIDDQLDFVDDQEFGMTDDTAELEQMVADAAEEASQAAEDIEEQEFAQEPEMKMDVEDAIDLDDPGDELPVLDDIAEDAPVLEDAIDEDMDMMSEDPGMGGSELDAGLDEPDIDEPGLDESEQEIPQLEPEAMSPEEIEATLNAMDGADDFSEEDEVMEGKTAEDIADDILAENGVEDDDEEFNLEDFDISETDDLPSEDEDDKKD